MAEVGSRLGVTASRVAADRRLFLVRLFGSLFAVNAAVMVTFSFGPGSVPWVIALAGVGMTISGAMMGFHGTTLSVQVENEKAGAFTTDRWSWSGRPEVAAGTDVVIRAAGAPPLPRAVHRDRVAQARRIARGEAIVEPWLVYPAETEASSPPRLDWSLVYGAGVLAGVAVYSGVFLMVAVGMGMWMMAITIGLSAALAVGPIGGVIVWRVLRLRADQAGRDRIR